MSEDNPKEMDLLQTTSFISTIKQDVLRTVLKRSKEQGPVQKISFINTIKQDV